MKVVIMFCITPRCVSLCVYFHRYPEIHANVEDRGRERDRKREILLLQIQGHYIISEKMQYVRLIRDPLSLFTF